MGEKERLQELPEKKICVVCGDQALSYNFNAVTCESCKAFFRRNALKDKKMRCAFRNCCEITQVTRRFCQSCRLVKCLSVGMKREMIMTETQKTLNKQKTLTKQKMSLTKSVLSQTSGTTPAETSGHVSPVWGQPSCQAPPSAKVDMSTQTDSTPCSCGNTFTVASRSSSCPDGSLKQVELPYAKLLDHLLSANEALNAPIDQEVAYLTGDEFKKCGGGGGSLLDVINLTAVAIRRLIKMCKRIDGFRALCQQDQVSLLKQGCTQMLLLRSVLNYDPDRNSWNIPHTVDQLSRIKMEVLKEARGNLYEAHRSFLRSFDGRASKDRRLISVLTTIVLFDPCRPNLVDTEAIRLQQESYYELLRWYLDTIYDRREAGRVFDHLIDKMEELHRLNEELVRVYLNVNPSHVEPLLIEIFDLNTQ